MESLKQSTSVYDNEIERPRSRSNRPESIPLKGSVSSEDDALLRVIIGSFIVLSAAVTIALAFQVYIGDYQVVPHGSVATDSLHCSTIGTNILKKGGNAVDAAIAAVLCLGVVNPHVTGLGGGGFMLVYNYRRSNVIKALDFRETAPASAALGVPRGIRFGAQTVGIPGLLRGLGQAHDQFGKLSWKDLVEPAVILARQGFPAPKSLVAARKLLPLATDSTNRLHNLLQSLEPGQTLKMPELADSLEAIALGGPDELYTGNVSKVILSSASGLLNDKELRDYRVNDREPILGTFAGFDVIVPGAPSGGPLLLESLQSANPNLTEDKDAMLNIAQVARQASISFYAENGDPNFALPSGPLPKKLESYFYPETTGSAVSVIDTNDLYVSVVSTINSPLGSQILTKGGFILNNALASFDRPVTPQAPGFPSPAPGSLSPAPGFPFPAPGFPFPAPGFPSPAPGFPSPAPGFPSPAPGFPSPEPELSFPGTSTQTSRRARTITDLAVANNVAPGKRPISLLTPAIIVESGKVCGRRLVLGGSDPATVAQVLWRLLVFGVDFNSVDDRRARISSTGGVALENEGGGYAVSSSVNFVEKTGDILASHSDIRGGGIPSRF